MSLTMWRRIAFNARRYFDVGEGRTAFGRALLRERHRALQKQVPLLYLIGFVNFFGLALAGGATAGDLLVPAIVMSLVALTRIVQWRGRRHRSANPAQILSELRITVVVAILMSLGLGLCAISLYTAVAAHDRNLVILFTSLAALGGAYSLSCFPAAARMPLLFFVLPLGLWLVLSPIEATFGVGLSLILITFLVLRLVELHSKGFVELVRSRSEIEIERRRAQKAEQAAVAEKARVRQVADTDPLTGVANRRAFLAVLEAEMAGRGAPSFALALLDLDGFKPINDTFGHAAGDAVLIEVAERLRRNAGPAAQVARVGGDEFALMLHGETEEAAKRQAEILCDAISKPYRVGGREFRISACCGLTMVQPGADSVASALGHCDAALYSGKQRGRGCVSLFTAELDAANRRRVAIERALRDPAFGDQISIAYQPIFDLGSNRLRALEALARWTHPELGVISPSEFVPITEQINAVERTTELLLERAAAEAAGWPDAIRLSFNLSAVELCSAASAARILRTLRKQGLDPIRLQIEVTETALLADFEAARFNLQALRKAGARIVLDDFGAGFASVSYLRELAFDAIKLDGSLVTAGARNAPGMRLLKGVLDMCAALHLPCIAEHIETAEQLSLLRRLGCRDGQGFALSPPLDPVSARALAAAKLVPFPLLSARSKPYRAA